MAQKVPKWVKKGVKVVQKVGRASNFLPKMGKKGKMQGDEKSTHTRIGTGRWLAGTV